MLTTKTLRQAGEISSEVERALARGDDDRARAEAARHTHEIEDDAANVDESTRTSEP
jgi:hypothetical protein